MGSIDALSTPHNKQKRVVWCIFSNAHDKWPLHLNGAAALYPVGTAPAFSIKKQILRKAKRIFGDPFTMHNNQNKIIIKLKHGLSNQKNNRTVFGSGRRSIKILAWNNGMFHPKEVRSMDKDRLTVPKQCKPWAWPWRAACLWISL